MLVLSRKPNEAIMIGSDGKMRVKILAVNGCQVKLGIDAPRDIDVHREEVYLRIQKSSPTLTAEFEVLDGNKAANSIDFD